MYEGNADARKYLKIAGWPIPEQLETYINTDQSNYLNCFKALKPTVEVIEKIEGVKMVIHTAVYTETEKDKLYTLQREIEAQKEERKREARVAADAITEELQSKMQQNQGSDSDSNLTETQKIFLKVGSICKDDCAVNNYEYNKSCYDSCVQAHIRLK